MGWQPAISVPKKILPRGIMHRREAHIHFCGATVWVHFVLHRSRGYKRGSYLPGPVLDPGCNTPYDQGSNKMRAGNLKSPYPSLFSLFKFSGVKFLVSENCIKSESSSDLTKTKARVMDSHLRRSCSLEERSADSGTANLSQWGRVYLAGVGLHLNSIVSTGKRSLLSS